VNNVEPWKSSAEIGAVIEDMARALGSVMLKRGAQRPLMVGIHTGGVWVAERLQSLLGLSEPLGTLDIAFYRDDFTRIGMNPVVRPSRLPVSVDDRHIVLVDDVLHTGRTIRAALNELFDYGRPASVLLAVLAERSGRELPIEPDVAGLHAELSDQEQIKLNGPEPLELVVGPLKRRAGDRGAPP
jgi:pyrimidine operon attenuation protein/uracil phosphoribosyltransferase